MKYFTYFFRLNKNKLFLLINKECLKQVTRVCFGTKNYFNFGLFVRLFTKYNLFEYILLLIIK